MRTTFGPLTAALFAPLVTSPPAAAKSKVTIAAPKTTDAGTK